MLAAVALSVSGIAAEDSKTGAQAGQDTGDQGDGRATSATRRRCAGRRTSTRACSTASTAGSRSAGCCPSWPRTPARSPTSRAWWRAPCSTCSPATASRTRSSAPASWRRRPRPPALPEESQAPSGRAGCAGGSGTGIAGLGARRVEADRVPVVPAPRREWAERAWRRASCRSRVRSRSGRNRARPVRPSRASRSWWRRWRPARSPRSRRGADGDADADLAEAPVQDVARGAAGSPSRRPRFPAASSGARPAPQARFSPTNQALQCRRYPARRMRWTKSEPSRDTWEKYLCCSMSGGVTRGRAGEARVRRQRAQVVARPLGVEQAERGLGELRRCSPGPASRSWTRRRRPSAAGRGTRADRRSRGPSGPELMGGRVARPGVGRGRSGGGQHEREHRGRAQRDRKKPGSLGGFGGEPRGLWSGGGGAVHVSYVAPTAPPGALGPSHLDGYAMGLLSAPLWNESMPPAILDVDGTGRHRLPARSTRSRLSAARPGSGTLTGDGGPARSLPEEAGLRVHARARGRRRAAGLRRAASWSRSTTPAGSTGTCGWSTTARSRRGRCPAGCPTTRRRTAWRCTPRTTRSSTSSSRATSRRASTAPGR